MIRIHQKTKRAVIYIVSSLAAAGLIWFFFCGPENAYGENMFMQIFAVHEAIPPLIIYDNETYSEELNPTLKAEEISGFIEVGEITGIARRPSENLQSNVPELLGATLYEHPQYPDIIFIRSRSNDVYFPFHRVYN